jgi:hypothetical protein
MGNNQLIMYVQILFYVIRWMIAYVKCLCTPFCDTIKKCVYKYNRDKVTNTHTHIYKAINPRK